MTTESKPNLTVEHLSGKERKVKLYDFRRPDKFSRDQIRTIASLHEAVARLLTTSFSSRLREKLEVHLNSVDQMTYEEYIQQLPNPSVFYIINMDPIKGSVVCEMSPEITDAIIHRSFGGTGPGQKMDREVSPLDLIPLEEMSLGFMSCMREVWSVLLDLRPRLGQIEVNPQFCQIVPPTEMVVTVTWEIVSAHQKGLLRLAIPYLTLEPIIEKFSAKYWYSSFNMGPKKEAMVHLSRKLSFDMKTAISTEKLPLEKLLKLAKGDLIPLVTEGEKAEGGIYNDSDLLLGVQIHDLMAKTLSFTVQGKEPGQGDQAEVLEEVRRLRLDLAGGQKESAKPLIDVEPTPGSQAPPPPAPVDLSALSLPDDVDQLISLLSEERDQTLAWILSKLDTKVSAEILAKLPQDRQTSIAFSLATIEKSFLDAPNAYIGMHLQRMFQSFDGQTSSTISASQKLVDILQSGARSLEKTVIDGLLEKDQNLGKHIIDRMFVFEDLLTLDSVSLKKGLEEVEVSDLCISLKASGDDLRRGFLSSLDSKKRQDLEACLKGQGPLRVSEIEAAQNRVIAHFQKLDLQGEIIIPRADELVE